MTEQRLAPARDWRDTFRDATDLALLGILVTVAALPVLTTGAVVAVASEAIAVRFTDGHWLGPAQLWQSLRRRLLPGLVATLVVLLVGALFAADLLLLGSGAVPGGTALAWATGALGLVVLSTFALAVGQLGRGQGFRAAIGSTRTLVVARPGRLLAAAGLLLVAAFLATVLPVTTPLLVGYVLFALHTLTR